MALHLPLAAAGEIFTDPEALLYIDGRAQASADRYHHEIQLPEEVRDGRSRALVLHGWTEAAIMAAVDVQASLPIIIVALVQFTVNLPLTILLETALSFLGLGVQPPLTSLGQIMSEGRDRLLTAWWLTMIPGAVIFLLALSISLVGRWLRDRLDPTLRGARR